MLSMTPVGPDFALVPTQEDVLEAQRRLANLRFG
jgi:hypothetical protein